MAAVALACKLYRLAPSLPDYSGFCRRLVQDLAQHVGNIFGANFARVWFAQWCDFSLVVFLADSHFFLPFLPVLSNGIVDNEIAFLTERQIPIAGIFIQPHADLPGLIAAIFLTAFCEELLVIV